MALVKGTNSYVTVAEADAYFLGRIAATLWESALTQNKEKALITATRLLDEMSWTGVAVSDAQTLAFPRDGVYFDALYGCEIVLSSSYIPDRIINATYELALHLLQNEDVLEDTGDVRSMSIGNISLNTIISPQRVSSSVKRMIKPLLSSQGLNSWWRAN